MSHSVYQILRDLLVNVSKLCSRLYAVGYEIVNELIVPFQVSLMINTNLHSHTNHSAIPQRSLRGQNK